MIVEAKNLDKTNLSKLQIEYIKKFIPEIKGHYSFTVCKEE